MKLPPQNSYGDETGDRLAVSSSENDASTTPCATI